MAMARELFINAFSPEKLPNPREQRAKTSFPYRQRLCQPKKALRVFRFFAFASFFSLRPVRRCVTVF
jgi:hypothetical protein